MNKLETLKCVEVTSQRQADNGTLSYYDPQTGAFYNLYENGYVRRSLGRQKSWATSKMYETIYQLNPKRKGVWFNPYSKTSIQVIERVMLQTHEERIECAARAVVNYRNTVRKQVEEAKKRLEKTVKVEDRQSRMEALTLSEIQVEINQYDQGYLTSRMVLNNIKDLIDSLNF